MKIYFILFFSIIVSPLFGQTEPYELFKAEEKIGEKYYARNFGGIDTFIVKNEITIPEYRKDTVYHSEIINLMKIKVDTVYYQSDKCVDNTITTIDYYTLIAGNYYLKRPFVTKQVVLFPATTRTILLAHEHNYKTQIEIIKAVYGTKSEAVFTQSIDTRLVSKIDTFQVKIPNNNCNQYYEIIIHKYYSGQEKWSEEVVKIDETTRQYEEQIHYRQENELQKVEVLFPEVKLIKAIQRKLKKEDFYSGKITGELDFETQTAILNYQKKNNLPQGQLDLETIKYLKI